MPQAVTVVVENTHGLSAGVAALVGAGIAAVASLLTAVLTVWYQGRANSKVEAATAVRARIDRMTAQLSGLWGPLRLLTLQSAALAEKLREGKSTPRLWHLLDHLDEVVSDVADRAIAEQIIAVNGDVAQRISTHAGLLRDGDVPQSFIDFLGHYRLLRIAFEAATEGKPLPRESTAQRFEYYPTSLDTDVESAYTELQSERTSLIAA